MKQYNFKLNCGDDIINGTKISVKAYDEHAARVKVVGALGRATRSLQVESLELLGTGKLTPAQMMGSAGGKKSKRTISPEQQRKMQEARRKDSEENVELCDPPKSHQQKM